MSATLTIVVPTTCERPSLAATLESIWSQMATDDILVVDKNESPWGYAGRERGLHRAGTDAILFMSDDDVYVPGAFETIRRHYDTDPGRLHVFRMQYTDNDFTLWTEPVLREGNVATEMICVPNLGSMLGCFHRSGEYRYESDFDFVESTCHRIGPPIWHEEIIARITRPEVKDD